MIQFWSVNYIFQVCKLNSYFGHFGQYFWHFWKFWTIFTLIGSYFVALVKHFIANVQPLYSKLYFLILSGDFGSFCFLKEILSVFLYLSFFIQKTSNFHNSGMVGRRKPFYPSINNVFNFLSIGSQYAVSFKWHDFGLKCLDTLTPKGP